MKVSIVEEVQDCFADGFKLFKEPVEHDVPKSPVLTITMSKIGEKKVFDVKGKKDIEKVKNILEKHKVV